MVLKFCANLSFMYLETESLLERYNLAKQAGFKGVECAFPYDYSIKELTDAKSKAGLQQILINAYPGDWSNGDRGLAAIPGKMYEFKSSLELAIEYAKNLKCERIHIMSGIAPEETVEHMNVFKGNLKLAGEILKEHSIIGVIEPINKYSIPNYFLDSYDKAKSIIKEINCPNIKLQLDLFHMQQICGNLTKNIEDLLPLVGHIQVAQVPNRHEPNYPGEINYKYIFSLLEKLDYSDWIGLEYHPKYKTLDGLSWLTEFGYAL